MAFDPTLPTIEEAVPDALVAWMVARLATLNSMIARVDLPLSVAACTSAQIFRSDGMVIPKFDYWIAVRNGAKDSGLHVAPTFELFGESDGHGYDTHVNVMISAYVHPKALFDPDPAVHETVRERLLDRLSGFIRVVCFNNATGLLIQLGSREYAASPNFDEIKGGAVSEIYRGETGKGPDGTIYCPVAQTIYEGDIQ